MGQKHIHKSHFHRAKNTVESRKATPFVKGKRKTEVLHTPSAQEVNLGQGVECSQKFCILEIF